jgi:hypothetical protein
VATLSGLATDAKYRAEAHLHRHQPPVALQLRCWRSACHCGTIEPVIAQDRLQRAAAFIAQLHRLSIDNPHSWRRALAVGRDIGLVDVELEQAIRDAEKAGFVQRRADDEGLILLTAKGRAAASG